MELDIRAIKLTLGMDILRSKTPEMLRTELWSCLLVYNLIRESMLQAGLGSGRACRTLSLTATLQILGNLWLAGAIHDFDAELCNRQCHSLLVHFLAERHFFGPISH